MTQRSPADVYREREARFAASRDALARRSRLLSHGRLVAFAALIVLGLLVERSPTGLLVAATIVSALAFIVLVVAHRRTRARARWYGRLAELNAGGLDRLARRWERLPIRTSTRSIERHAYAADLDIFGRASISQILGPVSTPYGCATLDAWLLERSVPDDVPPRQAAVRDLADMVDFRDELALHAHGARAIGLEPLERFLRWAESDDSPAVRPWLRVVAWMLPILTWATVIAHVTGITSRALWLLPAAMSFGIYLTIAARARRMFAAAFGSEPLFAAYPEMIDVVARFEFVAPLLHSLRARLLDPRTDATTRLRELRRLMHLADFRLSSIHPIVFLLTLWDVHVLIALERWRREAGRAVREWIRILGEIEAVAALATLAHDQPGWCFPEIAPMPAPVFIARALGHPLIADDVRVHNDVEVGPPGTFLLITGSNMSGKSTLLRAIGVNAVLAQAGAPVCAALLRMPPLEVYTAIRVQDSLERGVSYFMAELERLKQIIDTAHAVHSSHHATLLFLLDEILHGTNTAERRIAATRVIRHLVDTGAIGAATTHDLALAESPTLASAARLVHFREEIVEVDGESTMRFDYLLRDGIATSTNALALMRIVGLPE